MSIVTGIVLFLMIWWTILFCVLPWKHRPQEAPETGTVASAPEHPHLALKFGITTILSILLWVFIYFLILSDTISFRNLADADIRQEKLTRQEHLDAQ